MMGSGVRVSPSAFREPSGVRDPSLRGAALDDSLPELFRAIAERDQSSALMLIERSPSLAHESAIEGATRAEATPWFLDGIEHYIYRGDTALHVAAAAYDEKVARALIARGADVRAANRRGAEPLHYA